MFLPAATNLRAAPSLFARLLLASLLCLTIARCDPIAPPPMFQKHARYFFEIGDVYGQIVWKGALDAERAVMYSVLDAPQLDPQRIYFEAIAAETVALDEFYEGASFRGTGIKLREVAAPAGDANEFSRIETSLLRRMQLDPLATRERFVTREPYGAFELLIAENDLDKSYNLYAEIAELGWWSDWASEAMSPGPLLIEPLESRKSELQL